MIGIEPDNSVNNIDTKKHVLQFTTTQNLNIPRTSIFQVTGFECSVATPYFL